MHDRLQAPTTRTMRTHIGGQDYCSHTICFSNSLRLQGVLMTPPTTVSYRLQSWMNGRKALALHRVKPMPLPFKQFVMLYIQHFLKHVANKRLHACMHVLN